MKLSALKERLREAPTPEPAPDPPPPDFSTSTSEPSFVGCTRLVLPFSFLNSKIGDHRDQVEEALAVAGFGPGTILLLEKDRDKLAGLNVVSFFVQQEKGDKRVVAASLYRKKQKDFVTHREFRLAIPQNAPRALQNLSPLTTKGVFPSGKELETAAKQELCSHRGWPGDTIVRIVNNFEPNSRTLRISVPGEPVLDTQARIKEDKNGIWRFDGSPRFPRASVRVFDTDYLE